MEDVAVQERMRSLRNELRCRREYVQPNVSKKGGINGVLVGKRYEPASDKRDYAERTAQTKITSFEEILCDVHEDNPTLSFMRAKCAGFEGKGDTTSKNAIEAFNILAQLENDPIDMNAMHWSFMKYGDLRKIYCREEGKSKTYSFIPIRDPNDPHFVLFVTPLGKIYRHPIHG